MDRNNEFLKRLGFVLIALASTAPFFLVGNAPILHADVQDPQAIVSQIFQRVSGVPLPLGSTLREQMLARVQARDYVGAARLATGSEDFINVAARQFAEPYSNRHSGPSDLNETVALIAGTIKDGSPFTDILTQQYTYKFPEGGSIPLWSSEDNRHYASADGLGAPLTSLQRVAGVRAELVDVPALFASREWAKEALSAGTNRRAAAMMLKQLACFDISEIKNTSLSDVRVRRDVDRQPGGDASAYQNDCKGCHSQLDPLSQAFAFMEWSTGYTPVEGQEPPQRAAYNKALSIDLEWTNGLGIQSLQTVENTDIVALNYSGQPIANRTVILGFGNGRWYGRTEVPNPSMPGYARLTLTESGDGGRTFALSPVDAQMRIALADSSSNLDYDWRASVGKNGIGIMSGTMMTYYDFASGRISRTFPVSNLVPDGMIFSGYYYYTVPLSEEAIRGEFIVLDDGSFLARRSPNRSGNVNDIPREFARLRPGATQADLLPGKIQLSGDTVERLITLLAATPEYLLGYVSTSTQVNFLLSYRGGAWTPIDPIVGAGIEEFVRSFRPRAAAIQGNRFYLAVGESSSYLVTGELPYNPASLTYVSSGDYANCARGDTANSGLPQIDKILALSDGTVALFYSNQSGSAFVADKQPRILKSAVPIEAFTMEQAGQRCRPISAAFASGFQEIRLPASTGYGDIPAMTMDPYVSVDGDRISIILSQTSERGGTRAMSKMNKNANVYWSGFTVQDDSWSLGTLAANGRTFEFDSGVALDGIGIASLGENFWRSRAFRECVPKRVFQQVCGRKADERDVELIEALGDVFHASNYNVKEIFAQIVGYHACVGI